MGGLESITVHEEGYMSVYINFLHSHSKQHKVIFSALNCEIKKVYSTAEPVNSTCGSVQCTMYKCSCIHEWLFCTLFYLAVSRQGIITLFCPLNDV